MADDGGEMLRSPPSSSLSQAFPQHCLHILQQLNLQRHYGVFCDVIIRIEKYDFKAHKCVLAAGCPKLQSMLYSIRQECGDVLSLKDLPVVGFRYILEFLYTGTLELKGVYIHDILTAAQYLEVRDVEKACLDYQYYKGISTASGTMSTPPQLPPAPQTPAPSVVPSPAPATEGVAYRLPGNSLLTSATTSQGQTYSTPVPPMIHSQLATQGATPSIHITPNLTFDTNYIEDYLKLIESMQGEQQQGTASSGSSSSRDYSRMHSSTYQDSTQYTSQYLPQSTPIASSKSIGFPNVPSHSGTFSVEDVRKTILSVLSQERFEDVPRESEVSINHQTPATPTGQPSRESASVTLPSISQIVNQHRISLPHTPELEPPVLIPEAPLSMSKENSMSNSAEVMSDQEELDGGMEDFDEERIEMNGEENEVKEEVQDDMMDEVKSEPEDAESVRGMPSPGPMPSPVNEGAGDKRQKRKKNTPVKLNEQTVDSDEDENREKEEESAEEEEEEEEDDNDDADDDDEQEPEKKLKRKSGMSMKRIRSLGRPRLHRTARAEKLKRRKKGLAKAACDRCGRHFTKQEALDKHMLLHEQEMLYSCHVCGLKYARPGELTRHLRKHSEETYSCECCMVDFQDPKEYKKHMQVNHNETKAFYCSFVGCNFKADKPSNLEKHAAIHSDVKLYVCPKCGKDFAQPNGLRSHLRSCLQQRNYLCDICGSKFNHLQSLKSHRLLHTGEKPHTCKDCGAKFTDHRNFKRHRRIHDNLFPYPCIHCDKSFRHSNSLKAHLKTHNITPASHTDVREAIFAQPFSQHLNKSYTEHSPNPLRDSVDMGRKLHPIVYCPEPPMSINKA